MAGTQIRIAPTIIATRIRQPFQSLPNSRREHVSYVLAQVRRQVQAGAVGKIDEIHNLNLATRAGADASDQLKYLAERYLQLNRGRPARVSGEAEIPEIASW